MVGSSLSEDRAQSRRGGLAGHHKPIRSGHTSSSSALCAGEQGTMSFCKTCNGPITARQSGHSPSRSTREREEARESSGSHVRRGGASGGRPPCRVEDGAVRIIHFKIAATVGRAGQTTSGRGRTLDGPVGEAAIGGTVACTSHGVATCRNPSSSEDSPSVDGGWSLDNVPPLPTANVQGVEHCLSYHNCETRNALEHGDVGTVARCGSLVAQGATVLANLSHEVPMNARSTLMSALINEEVHRRRFGR